jgi:hypothetical protein
MGRMVKEGATLELWDHVKQSRPYGPQSSSNEQNVEHNNHWQAEEKICVLVETGA